MSTPRKIVSIEDSFDQSEKFLSVTERYFTPFYYLSKGNDVDPEYQCVLFHSNRICMITLASLHPVIKYKKNIKKINFQISKKLDRLDNRVKGKGKKGAQHITPESILCFLECDDGSIYTIYGAVKGKLIEINEKLIDNSKLLVEKPTSNGYIAIILPNISDTDQLKSNLIAADEYLKLC